MAHREEPPPIEFAGSATHPADGWRALSERTGLPLERIAALGVADELRSLFDTRGRLRSRAQPRSLDAAGHLGPTEHRTIYQLLTDHMAKRWPADPQTPQQRLTEVLGKRWGP